MKQDDLNFRTKNTPAPIQTNNEVPASQKSSLDTAKPKTFDSIQMTSKSETIRKVSNLFSMALNEYRELRETSLTNREMGVRAEEICDFLRLKVMAALEANSGEI
jgi:BRCT domain type II-containing protein